MDYRLSVKSLEHFAHFDALMQCDSGAVVVGFSAPGDPLLDAMAGVSTRLRGQAVRFAHVDSHLRPGLAHRFHVGESPALLLFADGRPLEALVGRMQGRQIEEAAESAIAQARGDGIFSRLVALARGA